MNDKAKILLNRLESLTSKLNRLTLSLLILDVYSLTTFNFVVSEINLNIPIFNIELTNMIIFRLILSFALLYVFGLIGSKFIDYIEKKNAYHEIINNHTPEDYQKQNSFISNSPYKFYHSSPNNKEVARIFSIASLGLLFIGSNFISVFHIVELKTMKEAHVDFLLFTVIILHIILYDSFFRSTEGKLEKDFSDKKKQEQKSE